MSDSDYSDLKKTTFDGSRREQLRQAQAMTVRQRLEALNGLTELSERIQAMLCRHTDTSPTADHTIADAHEQRMNNADRKQ